MTQISTTQQGNKQVDDKNAIRPFHVSFPIGLNRIRVDRGRLAGIELRRIHRG
jgi:hypothetical protein